MSMVIWRYAFTPIIINQKRVISIAVSIISQNLVPYRRAYNPCNSARGDPMDKILDNGNSTGSLALAEDHRQWIENALTSLGRALDFYTRNRWRIWLALLSDEDAHIASETIPYHGRLLVNRVFIPLHRRWHIFNQSLIDKDDTKLRFKI